MTASAPAASPAPPQVLLAPHLRQLKLPTFLREYEKVAAEAAREGLDHVRFLCASPSSNSSIAKGAWSSAASAPPAFPR
jgi:hypothetical protein